MASQSLDWAKVQGEEQDDLLATTRMLVNEDGVIASSMLAIKRLTNATANFPHKVCGK